VHFGPHSRDERDTFWGMPRKGTGAGPGIVGKGQAGSPAQSQHRQGGTYTQAYSPMGGVTPVDENEQLLTLEELGIVEVDPGVVEDSFENRTKLREAGYRWTQATDREPGGLPLLQTINTAEGRRDSLERIRRKSEILVDENDPWSDYVSPLDLARDSPAPFWVKNAAYKWEKAEQEGKDPANRSSFWLPIRCHAIKGDGTRCQMWAGTSTAQRDTGFCRIHLNQTGSRREEYIETTREKLAQAAPAAADVIEDLMLNAELETVRLKASTEILDRTGVRTGVEIDSNVIVEHLNASDAVRDRLDALRQARAQRMVIPGEVEE
jgi:hypothetical protein